MLLKLATLRDIEAGRITLAFRRWKKPTVKTGGRLRTRIGELAIEAVEVVTLGSLTTRDAKGAGYTSSAELRDALSGRDGKVYRVRLSLAGPDTRIALRAKSKLTPAELEQVTARLERMDAGSSNGAWTRATLELIARSPATRAGDLADELGQERLPFKQRVRRLKELGLTESLEVGYRLSPRGRAVLGAVPRRHA